MTRDTDTTCEHETSCWQAVREPWCHPCLLRLIEQVNDLNERLCDENEQLRSVLQRVRERLEYAGSDRQGAYLHELWSAAADALEHKRVPVPRSEDDGL